MSEASENRFWTTDNVGEAAPGVLTPLAWGLWGPTADRMLRNTARAIGVFTADEAWHPEDPAEWYAAAFHGRIAMRLDYLAAVGDRMPGTTGPDVVTDLFGRVPEEMAFHPTRRRYPAIAVRLPLAYTTTPGTIRRLAGETEVWWRHQISAIGSLGLADLRLTFRDAQTRFRELMTTHAIGLLAVVRPSFEILELLVARAGTGDVGLLSGTGGAEMAIVADLWDAAHGGGTLKQVMANHGFHGPREGEIASRVWREDPTPLERLLDDYAAQPDADSPHVRHRDNERRAREMRREITAALPRLQRGPAALALRLAAHRIPLRGVGKRSFLQALDVARASARAAGVILADDGNLGDPEDVFFLTPSELLAARFPAAGHELVAARRAQRASDLQLRLPTSWKGRPEPQSAFEFSAGSAQISGIGVSSGVIEGPVRVILDPAEAEVEPGEVLVSQTTDPSWASILFVSAALVVDVGGAMSHAAVVARELGIPCVVNTRTGTEELTTGDVVRVNGSTGTIDILVRAPTATAVGDADDPAGPAAERRSGLHDADSDRASADDPAADRPAPAPLRAVASEDPRPILPRDHRTLRVPSNPAVHEGAERITSPTGTSCSPAARVTRWN